jgi:hypothetical protein
VRRRIEAMANHDAGLLPTFDFSAVFEAIEVQDRLGPARNLVQIFVEQANRELENRGIELIPDFDSGISPGWLDTAWAVATKAADVEVLRNPDLQVVIEVAGCEAKEVLRAIRDAFAAGVEGAVYAGVVFFTVDNLLAAVAFRRVPKNSNATSKATTAPEPTTGAAEADDVFA